MQEKNRELESALLAKDRFLANMSHELRTPLNAILGFTGTLLMELPGPLTTEQEKQLRTVQNSAKHLLLVINDLLDLAKIESGKVELHLEPISCWSVVQEVVEVLRPMAHDKGLEFTAHCSTEELVMRSDRRALTQILVNLVNNAIKFTDVGKVSLEVVQRRIGGATRTEISVTDTGTGIRPDDQGRLFEAFTQVDGAATRRNEGTGLGLHLSRRLAELLGGTIAFQSDYGDGSKFSFVVEE